MSFYGASVSARIDIAHEARRQRRPGETAHDAMLRLLQVKGPSQTSPLGFRRKGNGQVIGRAGSVRSKKGKKKLGGADTIAR